jgi:hypothetical protein
MNNLVTDLTNWGLNAAFWSSIGFLLTISIVWPWWKSFWGFNIMMLELAIALALFPPILARDFNVRIANSAAANWNEIVALWLVAIIVIWRGVMIATEQITAARRDSSNIAEIAVQRKRHYRNHKNDTDSTHSVT